MIVTRWVAERTAPTNIGVSRAPAGIFDFTPTTVPPTTSASVAINGPAATAGNHSVAGRVNCGQAGALGWTLPAALGVRAADQNRKIVALSGDYDFQFLIEELAVGAQHKLPYLHVVVNNSYLGLIRQAQRGFQMDFSLAFENINVEPEGDAVPGYGVDHVAVAEGLGCKAIRVKSANEFKDAFAKAKALTPRRRR